MIIYTFVKDRKIAYVQDPGNSDTTTLGPGFNELEMEYWTVQLALNEYFIRYARELDARQDDIDRELSLRTHEQEFTKVASPADETPRPLPGPIEIRCSNLMLVRQMNNDTPMVGDSNIKMARTLDQMTKNLSVRFVWVSVDENKASKLIRRI